MSKFLSNSKLVSTHCIDVGIGFKCDACDTETADLIIKPSYDRLGGRRDDMRCFCYSCAQQLI